MFTKAKTFTKAAMIAAVGFGAGCGTADPAADNQEIIQNLIQAGYPAKDIMVVEGLVYVQNDAHVTLQASREMLETTGTAEQYRTTNIVGTGVTRICINPTSAFTNTSGFIAGLDAAIANYNALGLRFTLQRGGTGCNANITAQTTSGAGGVAGFPSGGLPYGTINIGTGLTSYSADVREHVITHELGHCLGMRHSDYYNRAISCGSGGNEGASTVGAILISGTPSTATVGGSIMNACFRSTETGEFTSSDRTAFTTVY